LFEETVVDATSSAASDGNLNEGKIMVCVFPAIGTAMFAAEAIHHTDEMFIVAAETVADEVTEENLAVEVIYALVCRPLYAGDAE
jgi:malic enzyme